MSGVEYVDVPASGGVRNLTLVVTGLLGYSVDYDVTIETLPANACTNDGFEGLLGNNELTAHSPSTKARTNITCVAMKTGSPST